MPPTWVTVRLAGFTPRPCRTAPRLRTLMGWLLVVTPRRPSASPGLAAAPSEDCRFRIDKSPPTAVRLLTVLVRPEAAPWALSTAADSDNRSMVPVEIGVFRETVGTDLLSAAPVEETLYFGSTWFTVETAGSVEELAFRGESELA